MRREFWFRVLFAFALLWVFGTFYGVVSNVPDEVYVSNVVECDPNYEVCNF